MQKAVGEPQHVRVLGDMTCFTRPECRTERHSSIAGSVSAWDGLLSQVMGHRGAHYDILTVGMLFKPRYLVQTANEVRDFGTGARGSINTESKRTLRTTSYVAGEPRTIHTRSFEGVVEPRDFAGVDYIVSFRFATSDSRDFTKLEDMLNRRLRNGHFWRQPYLGMRELIANVEPVKGFGEGLVFINPDKTTSVIPYPDVCLYTHDNGLKTVDHNEDLGLSFYGIDWDDPSHPHYFYPMTVEHGLLKYPTWDEVRALGISRKGTR